MATGKNHTGILRKLLVEFIGQEDPLLAMLEWTAQQMMQIEAEVKVGAKKGEHSKDRLTHFSGRRVRRMDTRLGTVYLFIPKLRKGGYVPFFISERKRSEQALISLVREAYINGVSTRKIERLAKTLGIENISASQVSEINKGLSEQVEEFRSRPLEAEYPFLWIDALYEKVRMDGRVVSMALMIALAVNTDGQREILAIEPMLEESEDSWREFFRKLKAIEACKKSVFASQTLTPASRRPCEPNGWGLPGSAAKCILCAMPWPGSLGGRKNILPLVSNRSGSNRIRPWL